MSAHERVDLTSWYLVHELVVSWYIETSRNRRTSGWLPALYIEPLHLQLFLRHGAQLDRHRFTACQSDGPMRALVGNRTETNSVLTCRRCGCGLQHDIRAGGVGVVTTEYIVAELEKSLILVQSL